MTLRIPLAKPEITDADREAVMEVLRTPYLSTGPKVAEFERAVCVYTGAAQAVAVNSGTSALQLAIRALAIEPGSEVILPSFTFSAVLNVILLEGLRPRFVDVDPRTYNCTAEAMVAAITDETRLIIAVHTFGFPVDVAAILSELTRRSGTKKVYLIEDACEALGADVRGRKAGSLADAGLFAFYPNKQITTGEGGMLVTSDETLADKAAKLRNQGRDPSLGWNSHSEIGFSYRISDINCALGISQLGRIEEIIARRQRLAEIYDHELANIGPIIRPPLTSDTGRVSWFVYPVQLAGDFTAEDRDRICDTMLQKGIATGRYFAPLHRQPVLISSSVALDSSLKSSTTKDTKAHEGTKGEQRLTGQGSSAAGMNQVPVAHWQNDVEHHAPGPMKRNTPGNDSPVQQHNDVDSGDAAAQRRAPSSPDQPAPAMDRDLSAIGRSAGQRRNLNSSARECRESISDTGGVRFSGRHEPFETAALPNTDFVADRVIQLPFFNELTVAEIREVAGALRQAIHELRRNT